MRCVKLLILILSAKFLITSGVSGLGEARNPFPFEVIDLVIPNQKYELALNVENIPKRTECVAGLVQDKLIMCGGTIPNSEAEYFKDCYVFGQKGPGMELLELRHNFRGNIVRDVGEGSLFKDSQVLLDSRSTEKLGIRGPKATYI